MKSKITKGIYLFLGFVLPVTTFATGQINTGVGGNVGPSDGLGSPNDGTIIGILKQIIEILKVVIELIIGLAVVIFLWGVALYVVSKSQEDKEKARGYMIWGIIGLFVMVSVWGLVALLTTTFLGGVPVNTPPAIPTL